MLKLIHRRISQIIINSFFMPNSNGKGYSYSSGSQPGCTTDLSGRVFHYPHAQARPQPNEITTLEMRL